MRVDAIGWNIETERVRVIDSYSKISHTRHDRK